MLFAYQKVVYHAWLITHAWPKQAFDWGQETLRGKAAPAFWPSKANGAV